MTFSLLLDCQSGGLANVYQVRGKATAIYACLKRKCWRKNKIFTQEFFVREESFEASVSFECRGDEEGMCWRYLNSRQKRKNKKD